jgi:hypothetical protein
MMKITALKTRQLTWMALLVALLCYANVAFAKSRFVPTPDDSNATDSASNQENSAVIKQAAHDFEMSMSRWEKGHFGALLFYHQTEGPLTSEFQDIIERDPDLPRVPVFHETECITCNTPGECDATVTIKFSTETTAKLRQYHLQNTGLWSPYSETTLKDSPELRASLNACKTRNKDIFSSNKNEGTMHQKSIDFSKMMEDVRLAFEKSMRAFRDEKWSDLLPLLAPLPQKTIREQLAKPNGEQELIKTGRLPVTWEFECASPFASSFYAYAHMANRNDNGMKPFRFTFVNGNEGPNKRGLEKWLLAETKELSEKGFFHETQPCIHWRERIKQSK